MSDLPRTEMKSAYGELPADKFPGPPNDILRAIDSLLSAYEGRSHE